MAIAAPPLVLLLTFSPNENGRESLSPFEWRAPRLRQQHGTISSRKNARIHTWTDISTHSTPGCVEIKSAEDLFFFFFYNFASKATSFFKR
jgi:hypothetical protein